LQLFSHTYGSDDIAFLLGSFVGVIVGVVNFFLKKNIFDIRGLAMPVYG